jgi:hypothetical protein
LPGPFFSVQISTFSPTLTHHSTKWDQFNPANTLRLLGEIFLFFF